jgi:hypothetical protein
MAIVEQQLTLGLHEPDDLLDYIDEWNTDDGFEATIIPEPTQHEPGSPGKVEVLAERLRLGHQLWNEKDAKRSRGATAILEALQMHVED